MGATYDSRNSNKLEQNLLISPMISDAIANARS